MDHNCAENFTNANFCQDTLDTIRDASMQQVEDHLQGSILLSIETGLYTLSAALFVMSTYILWSKGILVRVNLAMWLATLIMFTGSTIHYRFNWAQVLANNTANQQELDMFWSSFYGNDTDGPLLDLPVIYAVLQYVPIVNYVLSDVIVFWRAWILWNRSRWILSLASILICGTTVGAIVSAQVTKGSRTLSRILVAASIPHCNEMIIGVRVVWAMSLGSNILATVLIGYKAYHYRASIAAYLKGASRWTKTESILILLIESAVLYCGTWIFYIASQVPTVTWTSAQIMFNDTMPLILSQMAGLYPTAIIVLVSLQKTTWDMTASTRITPTRVMEFAMREVPPNTSALSANFGIDTTNLSVRSSVIEIGEQRLVVGGHNHETAEV